MRAQLALQVIILSLKLPPFHLTSPSAARLTTRGATSSFACSASMGSMEAARWAEGPAPVKTNAIPLQIRRPSLLGAANEDQPVAFGTVEHRLFGEQVSALMEE